MGKTNFELLKEINILKRALDLACQVESENRLIRPYSKEYCMEVAQQQIDKEYEVKYGDTGFTTMTAITFHAIQCDKCKGEFDIFDHRIRETMHHCPKCKRKIVKKEFE